MLNFVHLGKKRLWICPSHPQVAHLFFKFIYLFLAAFGLCYCARAFSSCGERGLLFVVVHVLLIAVASLVAEYGL